MDERMIETVNFLFTDIEGSTQLWEHEPEAMSEALVRHDALLGQAVAAHGGRVFKTIGDAFCVAFREPGAAVAAAVTAQRMLSAEPWAIGPLSVRMALHRGRAEVRDGDYFGPVLNRAARLLSAAHGGQVVLSHRIADSVREALPEGMDLLDLGAHRLRDLTEHERIYQVLAPELPSEFPALRSLDYLPNNLPRQLTSFLGRRKEMAEVSRLLTENRLVTLTGAGGSGKTRLILQVTAGILDRFEDGVWFVDLSALREPELVPQAVASALGVPGARRPSPRDGIRARARGPAPDEHLTERLVDFLRTRDVLLILDNCEHLIGACARMVATLLAACPDLQVVTTSREPLGIPGEAVWHVPSMSLPDPGAVLGARALMDYTAVRLFVERARAASPAFDLTDENAPTVAHVVSRLDGIPLAIELAAVRVKLLSVEQIARRLDDRFRLLTGGSRAALPRQQTLRATMDWSFDLLTDPERALLRRLAVFADGFALEAAESVYGSTDDGEPDALGLLSMLVDKSLVAVDVRGTAPRYRLLETVLSYGLDRLVEAGEGEDARTLHRDWFLGLAEEAAPELTGPDQGAWLSRLWLERRNLRAALHWSIDSGEADETLRLAGALWYYWFVRGHLAEGRGWLEAALELDGDATPGARAQALLGAGALAWRQRAYAEGEAKCEASLARFRSQADERGMARALHFLGLCRQFRGDYEAAEANYRESLALWRSVGDRQGVAAMLDILGLVAWLRGDFAPATELLAESLELARAVRDQRGIADSLNILGRVAHDRGDFEEATRLYRESLSAFAALGDQVNVAFAHNKLGSVLRDGGDRVLAAARLSEALRMFEELGDHRGLAYARISLGNVARDEGDLARAAILLEEALVGARALGDKRGVADASSNLGLVELRRDDPERACALLSEGLALYRGMGDKLGTAEGLERYAGCAAGTDPERAALLLGAAEALREAIGAPVAPAERTDHEWIVGLARSALDDAAFTAAWSAGRDLSREDALALALRARPETG